MKKHQKVYDFYFSQKMKEALMDSSYLRPRERRGTYVHAYYNGNEFTEATETLKNPVSAYDDLVFIGTGTYENVTYENDKP